MTTNGFVHGTFCTMLFMAALRSRRGHYIFALWFLSSNFLFFLA